VIAVAIESVGLAAPGLTSWAAAQPVLRGESRYEVGAEAPYAPNLLPPNERRRATAAVRQAFRAGEDALAGCALDPSQLASVFASSDADMAVLHRMCTAVAETTRIVSPTDFHNSVHNAASGYFTIAIKSMAPTTTVAAFDASFAAGLLEAATLTAANDVSTLLVVYDVIAPAPLLAARTLGSSGSVAVVLTPRPTERLLGRLEIALTAGEPTACRLPALEPLRADCPALRALPLLEHLASGTRATVLVPATGGRSLALTLK
jgi:hypothetical protein